MFILLEPRILFLKCPPLFCAFGVMCLASVLLPLAAMVTFKTRSPSNMFTFYWVINKCASRDVKLLKLRSFVTMNMRIYHLDQKPEPVKSGWNYEQLNVGCPRTEQFVMTVDNFWPSTKTDTYCKKELRQRVISVSPICNNCIIKVKIKWAFLQHRWLFYHREYPHTTYLISTKRVHLPSAPILKKCK